MSEATTDEETARARVGASRRTLVVLVALAGVLAAVALASVLGLFGGGAKAGGGTLGSAFATGVASVRRQSLSSQTQVSATLGYVGVSSIVVPAGTAPEAVAQARQPVANDTGMLQVARAALVADAAALARMQVALVAARAKRSVDCAGANAAQGAAGNPPAGDASGSGACSSDAQTASTDEQSLSPAVAKVASDRAQVTAAARGLVADEAVLAAALSSEAVYGQSSTFTALPAVGQIVRRGQSLYAISGVPVILLYGSVAPWRAFIAGMPHGRDVAELNANLNALGYGKGLAGDRFTRATAAAIGALQSAHALTPSGQLLLGSVVFESGPVRVTSVTPTPGETVQPGPVLAITSTVRQVKIELDAGQQSAVKVGDPVIITLPNNQTTPGKVSYVGTVATTPASSGNQGSGGSSGPTIEVGVRPSNPAATGHLDQAPVDVSITTAHVDNALAVPVAALLALSGGGYALEEIGAGGAHRLVPVTLGLFDDADGLVQVSGTELAAGQRVVVPGE
jgi:hypothetical protein